MFLSQTHANEQTRLAFRTRWSIFMILAIVKQQLRQIRNISRFRFAIAGLLSIITKYKNNLKSRAHKECMAKIGRYVEPLRRCCCAEILPLRFLQGRPARRAFLFVCLFSGSFSGKRRTPIIVVVWITVHNTPGLWITRVLRPQGRFSLQWCSPKLFNRRYE